MSILNELLLEWAYSSPKDIVVALLTLILIRLVATTFLTWYKLRQFPGPLLGSVSYLWLGFNALSGRVGTNHMEIREKYGSGLIRIAPDMLIHDDPHIQRHVNAARSGYTKSDWYSSVRFDVSVHTMFSSQNVLYHDDVKARTHSGYSGKDFLQMEKILNDQIEKFKRLIRRKYLSAYGRTKPVDFSRVAQYFALDTLRMIALGQDFGYMASDSDVDGYIKETEAAAPLVNLALDVPFIAKFSNSRLVRRLLGPKKTDRAGVGVLLAAAERLVLTRFDHGSEDEGDMLGSFVQHGLSKSQCEAELLLLIAAGSDTVAGMIRQVVLNLATCPSAYQKLRQEIDDGIACGSISCPVTSVEGKSLPYLQAVVCETLRIQPPFFVLDPKVVPPGGDVLGSQFIPEGTKIVLNSWGLGRHGPTFGEDAYAFRPERFTEAPEEKRLEMERVVELLFGHGRYMCAGKTIASMIFNKVFVELFRVFDFQVLNPKHPYDEMQYQSILVNNMWMRLSERDSNSV